MSKSIFVIGGGAAGFFSAIAAAENNPSDKIVIFEKLPAVLGKVKISGGGRCNVTNVITDPKELIKFYPRGGKQLLNIFYRFGSKETVEWFEQRGVKLKTEPDGRIFPVTNNSQTIIDCLVNQAKENNIEIKTGMNITGIAKTDSGFEIKTSSENFYCDKLIITAGGSNKIWEILSSLGHNIVDPVPSLFTFNIAKPGDENFSSEQKLKCGITALAGVSVNDADIKIKGTRLNFRGPLLITHWGFSGPAILKLSSLGAVQLCKTDYKFELIIKWLPSFNHETFRDALLEMKSRNASKNLNSFAPFEIPKRLWSFFLSVCGIDEEKKWNDLSASGLACLVDEIMGGRYNISGKSTFKEEFVTAGGVDLNEVDLSKMESKKHKGLYFAGEILNIDGLTGGFNFQSAWSTGYIAGISQNS